MKKLLMVVALWSFFSCNKKDDDLLIKEQAVSLEEMVFPFRSSSDLDPLLEDIADSKYILLGEASHGTAEYYSWRSEITKRLILEKGISIIGVEGDWSDIYKINLYIKGRSEYNSAIEVLSTFDRWPTWMWANKEIAELTEWLKEYNQNKPDAGKVGFYGLDVYGVWEALQQAILYLENMDPKSGEIARQAYNCFSAYQKDEQDYAYDLKADCRKEFDHLFSLASSIRSKLPGNEDAFSAEQNALVAVNGEKYLKESTKNYAASWNIRDKHMAKSLNRLMEFWGKEKKAVVWEHNTHVGDARATDMKRKGMVNIGQLIREQHMDDGVYIVGFGSFEGTVLAGSHWGAPMQVMNVPKAPAETWENLLHHTFPKDKIVFMESLKKEKDFMKEIGHRAIGVVYNPANGRGNYVPSILPERYDAFIYMDKTTALEPIDISGIELRVGTSFQMND